MKKSVTIKAAWIGAGAIIFAAIIAGLFSLGKQEEQIFQTGNTNVFSKDHVEGDKIVNIGPSADDLERTFSKSAPAPISIPLVDLELKRVEMRGHPFKGLMSSPKTPHYVKGNVSRLFLVTECLHHCRTFI